MLETVTITIWWRECSPVAWLGGEIKVESIKGSRKMKMRFLSTTKSVSRSSTEIITNRPPQTWVCKNIFRIRLVSTSQFSKKFSQR